VTRALVTGAAGQDGLYLVAYLRRLGYEVVGVVPLGTTGERRRVQDLVGDVELVPADVTDTTSLARAIAHADPHEIYNLAGISSVRLAWDLPVRAADVNGVGVVRLLEAVRIAVPQEPERVRVFQASSVQIFGDVEGEWFCENTPIRPLSPYGAAKAFAHFAAASYRARYGMFISCGILGNHESPLQDEEFLLRRVTRAVGAIASGRLDVLTLYNLDGMRDWGYAGDYVRAMHAALQHDQPEDFVIASGNVHSVADVVEAAFAAVGIEEWRPYVKVTSVDTGQTRGGAKGDITRARRTLGWVPEVTFADLVAAMVREEDPAGLVRLPSVGGAR